MAFLKSIFKDDPVRVQRHTVPHFKGIDYRGAGTGGAGGAIAPPTILESRQNL